MTTDTPTFGALLKRLRLAAGLTQEALAERAALSAKAVSDLERDPLRLPRLETVALLAEALRLAPEGHARLLEAARPKELVPAQAPPGGPLDTLPERLAGTPHPLPRPPTPLIGRDHEIAGVDALLRGGASRLVTLAGPGGVGKTRLAVGVAERAAAAFADGVAFVDLAPLRDPALVGPAIAAAIGLSDRSDRPPLARLAEALRGQMLLLVLDNFEHVREAAPLVAALLAAAPRLAILVTSRVLLRLAGEQVYPVPALALPRRGSPLAPGELAAIPAVALFLARARARMPDFQITQANGPEVAAICTRLDGLPLAIELAAARAAVLSPHLLLERLDRQLALLTDGPSDLPERQRTLRAAIAWSYDLLDGRERLLLEQLAVCAGGWTLEAAEALCPGDGAAGDALVGLHALIDKHLVQRADGTREPRFTMLEMIREFALERLAARGAVSAAQRVHAAHTLRFAERAASYLHGPAQAAWFDRMDDEVANLRVAMTWLLESGEGQDARRLAWTLHWFWHVRGYLTEGRGWLDRAIAARGSGGGMDDAPSDVEEARMRYAAGLLAGVQGDLVAARAHLERSVELWRGLVATTGGEQEHNARACLVRALIQLLRTLGLQGDPSVPRRLPEALAVACALDDRRLTAEVRFGHGRGLLHSGGDVALARQMLLEAHTSFRDMGDLWHMGNIQVDLGVIALLKCDIPGARRSLGEALAAARALKDQALEALACHNQGEVARFTGDDVEAAAQYERSLRLYRAMGARAEAPRLVHNCGYLALHAGEPECARARFAKSLALFDALGQRRGMAEAVAGLAAVAAQEGTPEASLRAAHLWAAADAAHRAGGTHVWPVDQVERDRYELAARAVTGSRAFYAAYDASRSAPLDAIVSETLGTLPLS